jgi:hypothetical protein
MTSQFGSDLRGAQSAAPTAQNHLGGQYAVSGSVKAVGKLTHFLLLKGIERDTGIQ